MAKRLSVVFLWHMHQPLYKDLLTGKYHLPWVRLHSTYSYLDMASVLNEFPEIKCTFNLTPSLIWQLRDISDNGKVDDIYLELSEKPAEELTDEQKVFILKNFFSCDRATAIDPVKRYLEILEKRGDDLSPDVLLQKAGIFSDEEYRDLQVLFNLAWCGFTLRSEDNLVKELVSKGASFTEDEKKALIEKQQEVVSSILPLYKRLLDEGRIEISTTPFYHPIMPILCGGGGKGFDFTEDATVHIDKAVKLYKEVFEREPRGMWPSEGSVSPEIIPLLKRAGIEWIATDEGILLESFRGQGISRDDLVYRMFTAGKGSDAMDMVFRDINISNAISFRYSRIPARKAAEALVSDIQGIQRAMASSKGGRVLSVILDGENPWPYYSDGGREFLRETYKSLSAMKEVETCTLAGCLDTSEERTQIPELYSGSWINRNFKKWSGSPQKDRAWEYLAKARKELFSEKDPPPEAIEELYIAEGSDWFWWYDEFGTELNLVFDELFRMHLANIYRLIGREVPHYLEQAMPETLLSQGLPEISTPGEMARSLNILFVTAESAPFSKTGGLADVSAGLPRELLSLGCDVRVITPYYDCVAEKNLRTKKEKKSISCPFGGKMPPFGLLSHRSSGLTTYFLTNDAYYSRPHIYGGPSGGYKDNHLRFGYFSKAVFSAVEAVGFRPDVIHCNDWQTALIPFYLKYCLSGNGFYTGVKTLFTVHNLAYQGVFEKSVMKQLCIPESFFNMNDLEFYGKINFMKSGILYSDAVSTVSHRYAEEIMTSEYGCGLDGLIRSRRDVLYGIPNGADYSIWNPSVDGKIIRNYDARTLEGKAECKKDLIEYTGLDILPDMPILGCVTRLVEQKGMDLFAGIVDKLITMGAGIVVLGHGSDDYNRIFKGLAARYPRNVHVSLDFDDILAHKIEAGADIFVMPSRYEPCGLNQMYSLKYGTIPVVRATGGLDDVIIDFDGDRDHGNGFKFGPATSEALFRAVKRAIETYHKRGMWEKLVSNAMKCDYSWSRAAEKYFSLYRSIAG
jgi:starch synthase